MTPDVFCYFHIYLRPLQIFQTNAAWTTEIKDLRVIHDSKLTYSSHNINKANHTLRTFHPFLNKTSLVNIKFTSAIYNTLIRPIITHAAPV